MIHELKLFSESDGPLGPARRTEDVPEGFGLSFDRAHAQRHVLSDGFARHHSYLRISLVEHCNLRCRYCMPEGGLEWTPAPDLLTDGEIVRLAGLFVSEGVDKIRLTGGEPLLRQGVESIAESIGRLSGLRTLALTTNGLLLPKKFERLQAAGVNLINISLDTLRQDRFEEVTRRKGFHLVMRAIHEAIRRGYAPVKINCVVMRGVNDDEIADFVALTKDLPIEVRFIEFMPFDGNGWDVGSLFSFQEMIAVIERRFELQRQRNGPNDTSKTYRVPGFRGTVGFITSMTENFCEGCNRLRITADGNLKVCLFGSAEVSLRDAIRSGASDDDLRDIISAAVGRKRARHAGMHNIAAMQNRPMITIGG